MPPDPTGPCRLVVLGGAFAGLTLIRELLHTLPASAATALQVTLVEPKSYAEYTPGCLRALVDPSYLEHLTVPLRDAVPPSCHVLQGAAVSVVQAEGGTVYVQPPHGGAVIPVAYDLLVIATGSSYPEPCKASPSAHASPAARADNVTSTHAALALAQHVVIVGGGAVGVELAGELVHYWLHAGSPPAVPGSPASSCSPRRLTIVQATPTLLTGFHPSLCAAAEAWLRKEGVEILLEDIIASQRPPSTLGARDGVAVTRSGRTLPADVVFTCLGIRPHVSFMTATSANSSNAPPASPCFAAALREGDRRIVVDASFRVPGAPGVFACGDVAAHPCLEPGLAHTAEKHALVLAHSLARIVVKGWGPSRAALPPRPLAWRLVAAAARRRHATAASDSGGAAHALESPEWRAPSPWAASAPWDGPGVALVYPAALTGRPDAPVITVVSLGPTRALLSFNNVLCLTDPWIGQRLAAAAKITVERSKVAELRLAWLGLLFWRVAEVLSALAHVLVLTPKKTA